MSPYRIFQLSHANILYGDYEHTNAYTFARHARRSTFHVGGLDSAGEVGAMNVREFGARYRLGHTKQLRGDQRRSVACREVWQPHFTFGQRRQGIGMLATCTLCS